MLVDERLPLVAAAKELGVTYQAAYQLMLRGKLDAQQFGPRWYVTTASVRALQAKRAASAA